MELPDMTVASFMESGEPRIFVKESGNWYELHDYAFWKSVGSSTADEVFFGENPAAVVVSLPVISGSLTRAQALHSWFLLQTILVDGRSSTP